MFFLLFCTLLYFLPTIIAHEKRAFTGIFLLNFLLGWTVIGWIAALIWACASEARAPVLAVTGPGRYCCRCGAISPPAAHFCWSCGTRV